MGNQLGMSDLLQPFLLSTENLNASPVPHFRVFCIKKKCMVPLGRGAARGGGTGAARGGARESASLNFCAYLNFNNLGFQFPQKQSTHKVQN